MIKETFFQKHIIDRVNNIESEIMIPVLGHKKIDEAEVFIRSYLIPTEQQEKELESDQPRHDVLVPGFTQFGFGENSELVYLRYGNEDGVEPIISEIEYDGLRQDTIELCEEFRQLYTLYFDKKKSVYIHPQEEDRVVCRLDPQCTTIDKKYLKSFLAAKDKALVLYISSTIQEKNDEEYKTISIPVETSNTIGLININNYESKNYSQLYIKRIVGSCPVNQCNLWPFTEHHDYISFIIGTDQNGNTIEHSCDPSTLSDFFGKNPSEPHYLTPVFFDRAVLEKYIRQPERYQIVPGLLQCGRLWSISIDDENPDYISAYLGDLGRELPSADEQRHWRSHNKVIDGHLSEGKVQRDFFSIFSSSTVADNVFKTTYGTVKGKSEEVLGWPLFIGLSKEDEYNFTTLRIPIRESQDEFDSWVLSLVKVLIDSLNEKEILKRINDKESLQGGISKIERWFVEVGIQGFESHIKFLRNLQELRSSGTGHRKGKSYEKICTVFGLTDDNYKSVFTQILKDATAFLQFVDDNLNNLKGEVEA